MATTPKSDKRVLIIDDDEMVLRTLSTVLGRYYNVSTCNSATQSVDEVRRNRFDVIICDIRMPEHDGFWVLTQIRKFNPRVPVIFNSAYQDAVPSEDLEVVYQPFAYLTKGGNLGTFLATVDSALKSVG